MPEAELYSLRSAHRAHPLLGVARERELLHAASAGDEHATRELVQSHMRLVYRIAARYVRRGLALEDLVSEGVLGLMEALRRFDLEREARFSVYASWWIRARVSQFALANRRAVGMPSTRNARAVMRAYQRTERLLAQRLARAPALEEIARELSVSPDEVAEVRIALGVPDLSIESSADAPVQLVDGGDSPEGLVAELELAEQRKRHVENAMSALSSRERLLVHSQYLEEGARSLSELGHDYGVSRQRLGQVLGAARAKLKLELSRQSPQDAPSQLAYAGGF